MSLPLRKRGLKFCLVDKHHLVQRRFPCGSVDWNCSISAAWSASNCRFPCGSVDWNIQSLKHGTVPNIVASLAEAWIEINSLSPMPRIWTVASLAEAWIEIYYNPDNEESAIVASLAEAWIEMSYAVSKGTGITSLPLRKRGLKSWKCDGQLAGSTVASLAEAWIEIATRHEQCNSYPSLPLRKRGLKLVPILAGIDAARRFPCGSVDWNAVEQLLLMGVIVASLAEVWIEI